MSTTPLHETTERNPAGSKTTVARLPQALGERIDIRPVVESLRPLIAASEEQTENDRRLPAALVEAMYEAGIFQTIHPREFGGLELHRLDWLDLVFELSRINGSVGWIAMLNNGEIPLPEPELLQELYDRAGGRYIVSGSHGRIGEAHPVAGGYRFTGHWAFASGAPWATYITAYAAIMDEDGNALKNPFDGGPIHVDGIFHRDDVDFIEDSWNSLGLRGTASGEFKLDGVFCERRRANASSNAYRDRALFRTNSGLAGQAMVLLGTAQGAIDRFIELASTKRRSNSWANRANSLGGEQLHQVRIAHADAMIRGARAWTQEIVARQYDGAFSKDPELRYQLMVENMQAGSYAVRVAKEAIGLVFDVAGTDSVIEGRGIERCFRDVHTAGQHSGTLEVMTAPFGEYYLTRDQPEGATLSTAGLLPPPPRRGAAARIWQLDRLHSTVGFRVRHHAVGTFRAYFGEFAATYDTDAGALSGSVKTASVKTFAMLAEHLLGPDFLAAQAHPEIAFSSSAVQIEGDRLTVQGDLTLRGVTRPVTASGVLVGPSRDEGFGADNSFLGMDVEIAIDRRDFGLDYNDELLDGQLNLGWDVTLELSLEFGRPAQDG